MTKNGEKKQVKKGVEVGVKMGGKRAEIWVENRILKMHQTENDIS